MTTIPQFYVYILARPDDRVFYVGKGKGKRVFMHDREARSGHKCHKCNVIRKLWKQGKEYKRYIVFTTENEQEAFNYERELIALHGRKNLCNLTDGGEGCSGRVLSAETKAKISARHKGKKYALGLKRTAETRARMSAVRIGKRNTPEAIEKMRQKLTGRKQPTEQVERTRQRMIGNKHGTGNQNVWNKGKNLPVELRNRISTTLKERSPWKGRRHTPESIERMRVAQKKVTHKSKDYEVTSPTNEVFQVHNLKTFCDEHKFQYSSIQRAIRTNKTHKGWRIRRL